MVKLVGRYLADHKEVFDDPKRRTALVNTLESFVAAGWPSVRRLFYRCPNSSSRLQRANTLLGRDRDRLAIDELAKYLDFRVTKLELRLHRSHCSALEPAESPHEQQNREGDAQQPKKSCSSHVCLLPASTTSLHRPSCEQASGVTALKGITLAAMSLGHPRKYAPLTARPRRPRGPFSSNGFEFAEQCPKKETEAAGVQPPFPALVTAAITEDDYPSALLWGHGKQTYSKAALGFG